MAKTKTATVRITLRLDLNDPTSRALHRIIQSSTPIKLGQIVQGAVLAALARHFRTESIAEAILTERSRGVSGDTDT